MAVTGRRSWLGELLDRWRYSESGRRDARLDLLRGYAVFAMIVDHVAGLSWITPFTGANRFVTSAAEGFVFLAGFVMGMVYQRRIERDGWLPAAESILRRATVLYLVTVGLTFIFVILFQFTSLSLWLDRAYGLGLTDPVELVVGTLTLHYTYHGTDILWMYTILIAFSPIVFLLLGLKRTRFVLAASWALWAVYQFFPNQATIPWVATNVNYFPIAAWQVLFVTGLVWGYHRDAVARVLGRIPMRLALVVFAAAMLFLVLLQRAHDTGRLASWPALGWLAGEAFLDVFDKPTVAPARLLAFAILAGFTYSLVSVFWTPIHRGLGWLLMPLGTNALRAYGVHLLLIVVVYNVDFLARLYDRSRTGNTIIQLVTVGLTLGIVVIWKRLEQGIAWRPALPQWPVWLPQRRAIIGAAIAGVVLLTIGGAYLAGPVRGTRQADPTTAVAEAGLLRFVPPAAASGDPVPVLLALHPDDQTGPEFAAPLVPIARDNGWALVAPTIPYGDWTDPDLVAADAAENLPRLEDLIVGLAAHAEVPLQPRVMVLGSGRGAHTARQLALFYPRLVSAVATVGPAPCTLPVPMSSEAEPTPLPFPAGTGDVGQYVGEPRSIDLIRQVAFWIGVDTDARDTIATCPWGRLANREPVERAQVVADRLARNGVSAQVATASGPDATATLTSQAITFLRANQARASR